jgi:hypothetical protein
VQPSGQPTTSPSAQPSEKPTTTPSLMPSNQPTSLYTVCITVKSADK